MKKILLAILIVSYITSCCKQQNTNQAKIPGLGKIITANTSLNGYDESRAKNMTDTFYKYKDADKYGQKAMSVWFSKEQINDIDTLLEGEKAKYGTDGIRLYFGCDPPLPGNRQLTLSLVLVSTKTRSQSDSSLSAHMDYYNHTSNFLGLGLFGDVTYNSIPPGASLYNKTKPCSSTNDTCKYPSYHYLKCDDAYTWVQTHVGSKPDLSAINTRSEWFNLCFFSTLNAALQDPKNNLDGLRIYLGKGYVDKKQRVRDVLILVPTYTVNSNHVDYYDCLSSVNSIACPDSASFRHGNYFFYTGYDNG